MPDILDSESTEIVANLLIETLQQAHRQARALMFSKLPVDLQHAVYHLEFDINHFQQLLRGRDGEKAQGSTQGVLRVHQGE